jgi:hypothetical protein
MRQGKPFLIRDGELFSVTTQPSAIVSFRHGRLVHDENVIGNGRGRPLPTREPSYTLNPRILAP